jgi:hypothetical protein
VARTYLSLRGQIYVSPDLYPVNAVSFIDRNGLRGNLVLPFDWGEYAIWHLYPRCRVNVDGRYTTAYPDGVLEQAFRFAAGAPGWKATIEHADIVLLDRGQRIVSDFFADPEWRYVYSDGISLVFVRDTMPLPADWDRTARTTTPGGFFFP